MAPAPYWVAKSDPRASDPSLCGGKAVGLSGLPSQWVPPYVVLTTRGTATLAETGRLPRGAGYRSLLDLLAKAPQGVVVRSSAVGETLAERGTYDSSDCEASLRAVQEQGKAVLEAAKAYDDKCSLAIIVQRFEDRHATGHLSNERRVSERPRRWFCEVELPDASERSFRLRADSASKPARSLKCTDEVSLKMVLREVAKRMTSEDQRFHLEWVWNGSRLYLVQCDREEPTVGSVPGGETGLPQSAPAHRLRTRVFHSVPKNLSQYPKINNVQTFKKAELPVGRFYILDDPDTLKKLGAGEVSELLQRDMERLVSMPLVIRTDVATSDATEQILRPRTDACLTVDAATRFLIGTTKALLQEGREANEFAFIAHHFIPARAGAMARASYPSPLVRVDATWGFPDGLSYYPHDSFEVDTRDPAKTVKKLRCKYEYMDVSPDGSWETRRTAVGWDWRSSLSDDELAVIADQALSLSKEIGRSVELMFFVGVDPDTGLAPVLPWFYSTGVAPDIDVPPAERLYGGRRQVIRDIHDLESTRARLGPAARGASIQIRLRPRFELLRSKPFLVAVADFAREYGAPVELEGSVLGHAFYMLAAEGVRLRCIEPFVEPERRQRFGKLVRDLIPVRIERHGESPTVYRATPAELRPLLREKLIEEAFEFFWTTSLDAAVEELADLYDLICALSEVSDSSIEQVVAAAAEKRAERGGFSEGIVLVETSRRRDGERDSGQLFGGKSLTRRTRARPAKRRPTLSGRDLSIPLIPADAGRDKWAAVLQLDEDTEVRVKYEGSDVRIVFREREPGSESTGQLRLLDNEDADSRGAA